MFHFLSEYQTLTVDALGLGIGPDAPFKQAVLISPPLVSIDRLDLYT